VAAGLLTYRGCRTTDVKSVEGFIYEERDPLRPNFLKPVPNVTILIAQDQKMSSQPTDENGHFMIKDIPQGFKVTQLIAKYAGHSIPSFNFENSGQYAIIPRENGSSQDIRIILDHWNETRSGECPTSAADAQVAHLKRYILSTHLEWDQNKKDAELTVILTEAGDAKIVDAYVLVPADGINQREHLYSTRSNTDTSHSWVFHNPAHALDVQLEICVGWNASANVISQDHLQTYLKME
ncbi:MAG: hypothetical protein WCD76_07880, partial [Pyrinomonadaceae bacterium]